MTDPWAGKLLIRCMGFDCRHEPGTCTADPAYQAHIRQQRNERTPDFVPVHKLPAWLSSEDVLQAIRDLAESGADKAVCWDMTQAVYRLVSQAHSLTVPSHPEPAREEGE